LPIHSLLIRINARVIGDSCAAIRGEGGGGVSQAIKPRSPQLFLPLQCIAVATTNPCSAQHSLLAPTSNGGHVPRLHRTTPRIKSASCAKQLATGSCTVLCGTVYSLLLLANTTVDPSMIHGSRLSCRQTRAELDGIDWCSCLTDDATVEWYPFAPHPSENDQSNSW
jgi:hypothetical protein